MSKERTKEEILINKRLPEMIRQEHLLRVYALSWQMIDGNQ